MSGQLVAVRSPLALYRHLLRRMAGSNLPSDAFSYYKHRIRQVYSTRALGGLRRHGELHAVVFARALGGLRKCGVARAIRGAWSCMQLCC